jgi:hypothetical protein
MEAERPSTPPEPVLDRHASRYGIYAFVLERMFAFGKVDLGLYDTLDDAIAKANELAQQMDPRAQDAAGVNPWIDLEIVERPFNARAALWFHNMITDPVAPAPVWILSKDGNVWPPVAVPGHPPRRPSHARFRVAEGVAGRNLRPIGTKPETYPDALQRLGRARSQRSTEVSLQITERHAVRLWLNTPVTLPVHGTAV